MRKNRIFGMLSATALLFAGACSNDTLDPGAQNGPDVDNAGDGVYLAVNFDLPSAKETRSYTDGENQSSGGTEVGRDYENTVKTAYIVLAKASDNSFIAAAKSSTLDPVGATGRSYRNTAMFTKTDLSQFYMSSTLTDADKDESGRYKVNVYVFANPTEDLSYFLDKTEFGDTNWVDYIGTYNETAVPGEAATPTENVIWDKDNFLMSNSATCTRLFPASMADWDNYTTEATAFNLTGMNNFGRPDEIDNLTAGNVYVERAAARYDFRDGALDGINNEDKSYNGFKAQTYHVVLDSDENPLVDVFLGKMSMVNMNREYYYMRRVSSNGLPTGQGFKLLGAELPWYSSATGQYLESEKGNYIVDALADWKAGTPAQGFAGKLNYPFFNEDGVMDNAETGSDSWYTSVIKDVLANGEADSWDVAEGATEGRYKTWRYLTEGVIPEVETQQEGISNGIVFKGQLQPARAAVDGDDEFTKKLLAALEITADGNKLHDPILYSFGGHIYCTWEHIQRMAVYLSLTSLSWNETTQKWDFNINRSTRIYNAVVGTGGFGKITFTCERVANAELKNADFLKPSDTDFIDDTLDPDHDSANAKYVAWKTAFPDSDDTVNDDETAELAYFNAFRDVAVDKSLITLYQTSYDEALGGWGYYCYYYYWNRHNDNGQEGIMGPMEFAVVRNNVYKLAVTKIARLGHPRISANDPDRPTPNTPDEKGDVYITVTCTTLPWVVRENTIEFK